MRCLTAVSTIVAVLFLAGGVACADGYVLGMNFFQFTNWGNGGGDGSGPAFQTGGWTATTDGAIWISTGGSNARAEHAGLELPVGLPLHAHVAVGHADRGYLLSNGVAYGDVVTWRQRLPNLSGLLAGRRRRDRDRTGNTNPDSTSPYADRVQGPRHVLLARDPAHGSPPAGQGDPAGDAVRLVRLDRRLQQLRCRRRRAAPKLPSAGHFRWAARPTMTR